MACCQARAEQHQRPYERGWPEVCGACNRHNHRCRPCDSSARHEDNRCRPCDSPTRPVVSGSSEGSLGAPRRHLVDRVGCRRSSSSRSRVTVKVLRVHKEQFLGITQAESTVQVNLARSRPASPCKLPPFKRRLRPPPSPPGPVPPLARFGFECRGSLRQRCDRRLRRLRFDSDKCLSWQAH
jgi:hypothetical protein